MKTKPAEGEKMNPRLVVVIGEKGVSLIRMVASSPKEEDEAINLYMKVKGKLRSIDKTLQTKVQSMPEVGINQ